MRLPHSLLTEAVHLVDLFVPPPEADSKNAWQGLAKAPRAFSRLAYKVSDHILQSLPPNKSRISSWPLVTDGSAQGLFLWLDSLTCGRQSYHEIGGTRPRVFSRAQYFHTMVAVLCNPSDAGAGA